MKPRSQTIKSLIKKRKVLILDGGLATELENAGHDIDHPLWSAHLVFENPEAIKRVHLSYLKAGADLIMTASYQASFLGCLNEGMSEKETEILLRKTVAIAEYARKEFLKGKEENHIKPMIAASVGPYGAYLTNGAEYKGNYGVSKQILHDFHLRRWEILASTKADLMACETIPSFEEAEVLQSILRKTPKREAYVSFSCKNEEYISDGTPIKECAEMLADNKQVIAVGVNCTAPEYISSLIGKVCEGAPEKAVIVYPNSGEIYDPNLRSWTGTSSKENLTKLAKEWLARGAALIGGCCRMGPKHIGVIKKALWNV